MLNLNDTIYKETTRHGKLVRNKLYRHSCDNCGSDRGYQAKSFITKKCNKCSHKGLTVSNSAKEKMSIAASKRYNDPNWQPKIQKEKYVGQRRTKYISKVDPLHKKIRHRTKTLLWQKIQNHNADKLGNTFDLLGYTIDELIKHLESKFQPGMSWGNYGRAGWHIDHIKPDSWFIYSSTEDQGFKDSWSLNNLQPMWESDNCSKGDRFIGSAK